MDVPPQPELREERPVRKLRPTYLEHRQSRIVARRYLRFWMQFSSGTKDLDTPRVRPLKWPLDARNGFRRKATTLVEGPYSVIVAVPKEAGR